jgi:hypothetical protein
MAQLNAHASAPPTGIITIQAGETFDWSAVWKPGGLPLDWTGYAVECRITYGSGQSYLLTNANGKILLNADGVQGRLRFWLEDEETAALPFAAGAFKMWRTDPAGKRKLIWRGQVRVQ